MLKIAIIGAGNMGSLHARIISELPNVSLVAICDSDITKVKTLSKTYQTKYYSDFKKLLASEALDGVIIATPTSLHKKVALNFIKRGINVLVEKPLAKSTKETNSIIKAAKKNNVLLTVGHIERFNPAVIKLKELIKRGDFGEVVSIVIRRVGIYPPRIKDVNIVTDLAVHDLDIVCDLLDKLPKSIYAMGGNGINTNQLDYADILLDFGRINCYLQVNWLTPIKIRNIAVTGTLGYGELNYITQELNLYKSKIKTPYFLPKKFEEFVTKLGELKKTTIKVKKQEPLKLELTDFINSIRKKQPPRVSAKQGHLAVKLSEIVLRSISSKKIIDLK